MKKSGLLILLAVFSLKISVAQQGKNGAELISANTTVNEYTALTIDADSGSTIITVSDNTLNTKGRFTSSLSAGDLVMIIQMQGATINGKAKDSTWGAVTNYNNCGLSEFAQVTGVSGSTIINLKCPIHNNYTASGNVQVVRIPRYTSLTINPGGTLTCDAWTGTIGGIICAEVTGNTILKSGGTIDASANGFRGGALQNSGYLNGITGFASTTADSAGQKGESIAGYQNGYKLFGGMYGRGAPANGGGGGNSTNSPGGGGANAGILNSWTGNGTPDTSTTTWKLAWNLEYSGFANSTSSGGGRGGYSWCGVNSDALKFGPGNPVWGDDDRRNVGGKGGRPLDYSTGRLFFGGGGGAGHENDNDGGAGGTGGGLIYLLSYGTISGSGIILSNGQNGLDDNAISGNGSGDGAGGGGGGGTVILNSSGAISGVVINANGGNGGNQIISNSEAEGPGGGGGGGYIGISNGSIITHVLGGANGVTNSVLVTEFIPNGATKGGNGLTDTLTTSVCILQNHPINGPVKVCPGSSNVYSVAPSPCGNATYTWILPTGWSGSSTTNTINITSGSNGGTIQVSVSTGSCPVDTTVQVAVFPSLVQPDLPKDTAICGTINFQLNGGSTGLNYSWSAGDTTPVITVTAAGLYKLKVYNDCDTLFDSANVIQNYAPKVFIGNDTAYCSDFTRVLNAGDSAISYKWSTGASTPTITVNTYGTYWVTVSNNCGQTTDSIKLTGCEGGYILPNAFTPGGENANNFIGLLKTGSGPTTLLYFRIYNRWGQLIFYTNDDQAKWDGRFNGLPEPIGVFVYVVSYTDSFGMNKLLKGNITLLR